MLSSPRFICYFLFLGFLLLPFSESADDMGLGKTLTIIALILAKKIKERKEDEKKDEKKLEKWISKAGKQNPAT